MSPNRRRGFTLIEMLVVIGILIALFAISVPVIGLVRERARVSGSDTLVEAVATAITAYQLSLWPVVDYRAGDSLRNYRAWDWNQDQDLDGHPEADVPGITAENHPHHALYDADPAPGRTLLAYRGFLETVRPDIPRQFRGEHGRVIDAWGRTLRIAWANKVYGGAGFGVWSLGPDGSDRILGREEDDADNLSSWMDDR